MAKRVAAGIRYERDMYAPAKAYFQSQGWEVKSEVQGCDIAAQRGGRLMLAEMKLTLNLDVLLQAVERQRAADIAYIVVPGKKKAMRTQRWRGSLELLKRLNIGLVVVWAAGGAFDAEELVEPAETGERPRGRAARKRVRIEQELNGRSGDWNTGGVHARKLVTAYREAALRVAQKLACGEPMSAKQLKPCGETSARTYRMLRDDHYGWFRRLGNGLFGLTDGGRKALAVYGEIVSGGAEPEEDVFSGTVEE
jgi:hypothetical protein